MHVAIDAAGGDFAPRNVIAGALVAFRRCGCGLTLAGDRPALRRELARPGAAGRAAIRLVDAGKAALSGCGRAAGAGKARA